MAAGRAGPRLKLFQQHLEPLSHLNTPFSTERAAPITPDPDPLSKQARYYSSRRSIAEVKEVPVKMSTQEPHPALLIPGPIEFDDAVLQAMSHYR
jgi:alanine-glyoxylate transaminase/serine-glyoxylate transaminase/serine-pyruvate transaminase